MQLTSLCSVQASLDTLRNHRPEYTPRTGFAWPIVNPSSISEDKKRTEEETSVMSQSDAGDSNSTGDVPGRKEDGAKRQQNNLLLMNAMRTTAAHMKTLPPSGSLPLGSAVEGHVASPSAALSSQPLPPGTPAATSSRGTTPAVGAEVSKGPAPVKKKKKRK